MSSLKICQGIVESIHNDQYNNIKTMGNEHNELFIIVELCGLKYWQVISTR